MKTKNPPKKLKLIKTTLAHLNHEQMHSAHGGNTTIGTTTKSYLIMCTDSGIDDYTNACLTNPDSTVA